MAGGKPNGYGHVAQSDLHAVGGDDVAFRRHGLVAIRIFLNQIPIWPTHNDPGPISSLEHLGTSDVINMCVGDDNLLDVFRIEAKLLHSTDDQFLGVIGIDSIDQNDPFSLSSRPRLSEAYR